MGRRDPSWERRGLLLMDSGQESRASPGDQGLVYDGSEAEEVGCSLTIHFIHSFIHLTNIY